jgi:hypothetical protein
MPHIDRERYAVVSCHVERPLDDFAWALFAELQERRPGGFAIAALMRPPDLDAGEERGRWLARARDAAGRAPLGHHTHWTAPGHARPTRGDPGQRVRREGAWLRGQGLEPSLFCGGGWYTDDAVRAVVAELGMIDCTPRGGLPSEGVLPTTHSLGQLARAVLTPGLPAYVHAYFHDYDLIDPTRVAPLVAALAVLRRRRRTTDLDSLAEALPQRD